MVLWIPHSPFWAVFSVWFCQKWRTFGWCFLNVPIVLSWGDCTPFQTSVSFCVSFVNSDNQQYFYPPWESSYSTTNSPGCLCSPRWEPQGRSSPRCQAHQTFYWNCGGPLPASYTSQSPKSWPGPDRGHWAWTLGCCEVSGLCAL